MRGGHWIDLFDSRLSAEHICGLVGVKPLIYYAVKSPHVKIEFRK